MLTAHALKQGMQVICVDNENVEDKLELNSLFQVSEVLERGLLIKVSGITQPFASSRFMPVKFQVNGPEGKSA